MPVEPLKRRVVRAITGSVEHPSFTFRLERVRTLRESAEAAAREELARELSHRVRGEALVRQATYAADAARDAGRHRAAGRASGADLMAAQVWLERAERRRLDAVADLHRLNGEVARSRAALAEAAREREVIERLERRQRADHDAAVLRVAQHALDEIALTVHRRGTAA